MFALWCRPKHQGTVYSKGNTRKLWPKVTPPVDSSVGDIRSQIAAEWLQIAQRSQHREPIYKETTIAVSNGAIADPLRPPLPPKCAIAQLSYAPRYANGHISATGDPIIHFMFGSMLVFSESADRMALFPVTSNQSWRQAAILDNFEWPYFLNGLFDPLI